MKHGALTLLILQLNKLLDSGKYDEVSIEEIRKQIDNGTILEFLRNIAQGDIDLSSHLSNSFGDFKTFYIQQLQSLYDAYAGCERRKWGIKNKGICLLLAWTNEIIQSGKNWEANTNISIR